VTSARAIRDRMMRGDRFSWGEVSSWIESDDIELMGAAFEALMSREPVVDGDVDHACAERFLVRYLVAALEGRADSAEVFAIQPYIAGHELARIYKHWRSRTRAPDVLKHARDELSRLYVTGDDAQKRRVVDGALEHIFESVPCRADFDEWKADPALAKAIEEAMEWAESRS
jgi:hypothetical protein